MGEEEDTPLIQVTNVSPQATDTQMRELFSYLGGIKEIRVYPESDSTLSFPSRVCFVKFATKASCETSLHLTNSILVDRALIVVKSKYTEIPDENVALSLAAPAIAVANIGSQQPVTHTAPLLPTPPNLLSLTAGAGNVGGTSVLGNPPTTAAATVAALSAAIPGLASVAQGMLQLPTSTSAPPATSNNSSSSKPLISVMGTVIPHPPPLTGNVDPTKIEEIRRTVYVGNLSTKLTAEQVLTFFQPCGEIKYVRMAGDETQPTRFAFVEFASPDSVPIALQYNGAMFGDRPVKVNHSKNAIVKPQGPTPQEERREVEEAMKRIKEANRALANSMEQAAVIEKPPKTEKKKRSRSPRSRSRSRSRSKSRRKKSRSRSRERRRRSSYSRSPRRRSRSPRRRSRTPPRHSSSRYSSRRDYGYSRRSPSPRRRHRDYHDRERDRDRDRERERDRERRERERERERRERRERRRSLSGSPRRSPHKSRSSRRKEKREYSHSPSSPSRSKRSKHSKKDKKKRHRRSPSYSVSPSPSAESESRSPSPVPRAGGEVGSVSWGSEEEGGGGRRRRGKLEDEAMDPDGGEQSSGRDSEEDYGEEEERRRRREEESRDEEDEESNDSSDHDEEDMSDVE